MMYNRQKAGQDLMALTDDNNDTVIGIIISRAEAIIQLHLGIDYVPSPLQSTLLEIALILYNRMGSEGLTAQSISSISNSFDQNLPQYILASLSAYQSTHLSNLNKPKIKGLSKCLRVF